MPKYLVSASYTADGVKGLMKDGGSARRNAVEQVAKSVGASVEAFYFAFGDNDLYVIVDAPDNVAATAASLVVNASGGAEATTLPLLTPEEVDAATQKSTEYRPPGA